MKLIFFFKFILCMFKLSSQQGSISSLLHSKFKRKKKNPLSMVFKIQPTYQQFKFMWLLLFVCVCETVHVSWCICGQRTALEIVLCSTVDWGWTRGARLVQKAFYHWAILQLYCKHFNDAKLKLMYQNSRDSCSKCESFRMLKSPWSK